MELIREEVDLVVSGQEKGVRSELYTLFDAESGCRVTVLTYGATLCRLEVVVNNEPVNVIKSFPHIQNYAEQEVNDCYLGATLGRYSRCIGLGRFTLDGVTHQLDQNIGQHHFHGGSHGFDKRVWKAKELPGQSTCALHLTLESEEGDQGYPGAVLAEVIYTLHKSSRLCIEYRASTSQPTPVALTNHAFWTLGSTTGIEHLQVKVNADRTIDMDEELIPTGGVSLVEGTQLDLRSLQEIGQRKVDHCFVLNEHPCAVELHNPENGMTLKMATDQPVLAVYSGDHCTPSRSGICLQSTWWPDAPNQRHFPTAILTPGEAYYHRTDITIEHSRERPK